MTEQFKKLQPGAKLKGFSLKEDDFITGEFIEIVKKEDLHQFPGLPLGLKESDLIKWQYKKELFLNKPQDLTIL